MVHKPWFTFPTLKDSGLVIGVSCVVPLTQISPLYAMVATRLIF